MLSKHPTPCYQCTLQLVERFIANFMFWALIGIYIVVHFLLYTIYFRRKEYFGTEQGIFLFHLVPLVCLVAIAFVAFLRNPSNDSFALIVGAGAAHGIYSLSFIELWLLSEGGYSLRILSELVRRGASTTSELQQQFVDVSARKKQGRLESLVALKLIEHDQDRFGLSKRGMVLVKAMVLVVILAGYQSPGWRK